MKTIGLFYGTTNGTTAEIASRIKAQFEQQFHQPVELLNIAEYYLEELVDFELIILGIPTWNYGQLQRDWEAIFEEFDEVDLSEKLIAIFGLGDQAGYPNTFADAMSFLADKVRERGATVVGAVPMDGYDFQQSWAVEDGKLLGMVIDEENQPELSDLRIANWIALLMQEFGLTNKDIFPEA